MAHTLQVLYRQPENPDAFRRYYLEHHLPLAREIPGAIALRYTIEVDSLTEQSPFIAVFEADFTDVESMHAALASAEGQRAQNDVGNFASGGLEILHFSQHC